MRNATLQPLMQILLHHTFSYRMTLRNDSWENCVSNIFISFFFQALRMIVFLNCFFKYCIQSIDVIDDHCLLSSAALWERISLSSLSHFSMRTREASAKSCSGSRAPTLSIVTEIVEKNKWM